MLCVHSEVVEGMHRAIVYHAGNLHVIDRNTPLTVREVTRQHGLSTVAWMPTRLYAVGMCASRCPETNHGVDAVLSEVAGVLSFVKAPRACSAGAAQWHSTAA